MELNIEHFDLPRCEFRVFEINGIKADEEDFGHGCDRDPFNAEPYCCKDYEFIANRLPKQEILDKYHITKEEYLEICDKLEHELCVGECQWCQ